MLPLLLLPVIIYSLLNIYFDSIAAVSALGILGVIGILFHKPFMNIIVKRFEKRKYIIADGFRER
jgi:xanthosine utilization system XapX-like protein